MNTISLSPAEVRLFWKAKGVPVRLLRMVEPAVPEPVSDRPGVHCYWDAYCGGPKTPENPRGMTEMWVWWGTDRRIYSGETACPFGKPGDRFRPKEAVLVLEVISIEAQAVGHAMAWAAMVCEK